VFTRNTPGGAETGSKKLLKRDRGGLVKKKNARIHARNKHKNDKKGDKKQRTPKSCKKKNPDYPAKRERKKGGVEKGRAQAGSL